MNWIKINFCNIPEDKCQNGYHAILENNRVCDLSTMPKEQGNYLVSDGKEIDVAECGYSFHNWNSRYDRKVKNKDILYWMDLKEIEIPKGE